MVNEKPPLSLVWRLTLSLIASVAGLIAGFYLPAIIAHAIGYGTGSYEDVLFIWMGTVPVGALLAGFLTWRKLAPPS